MLSVGNALIFRHLACYAGLLAVFGGMNLLIDKRAPVKSG